MRPRPAVDERLCATGPTGHAVIGELRMISGHAHEMICRCSTGWLTRDDTRFFFCHGYT
jgi:hypothetical protein